VVRIKANAVVQLPVKSCGRMQYIRSIPTRLGTE